MKSLSPRGVLLIVADFYGTLASVRSLGRAGVPVTVADWRRLVPARWSRYASRTLMCPDPTVQPARLVDWLLELGAREPGLVLLPTTDDLAWLFARHRTALAQHFVVDSPPLEAVYGVLNKWHLREACDAVGIESPRTWGIDDREQATFPLLIKPKTQTMLNPHQKGRIVREKSELDAQYADFLSTTKYSAPLLECDPDAATPMLQELLPPHDIYNLSGFVDPRAGHFVVSASRKVIQRPNVLGIGLCFQQAKVEEPLAAKLEALCRHVGYHGLFEVEFLEDGNRRLLIDFNPRSYGQMGFDIARGADLPLLAWLSAVGEHERLALEVGKAQQALAGTTEHAWCDRIALEV